MDDAARRGPGKRRARGRSVGLLLAAAAVGLVGCGSPPTEVLDAPVEILVASGDSQYGTAGQRLATPLHVSVRGVRTQLPAKGREVRWSVETGDASLVGSALTVTDSTGSARATVVMGSTTGEIQVRASIPGQGTASALFHLYLVDRPVLDAPPVSTVTPGQSLTLTGRNFSPTAEQNIILFSGIRGRVTSASGTSLTVVVPPCLPERTVQVTAQLGMVASLPQSLDVGAGGTVTDLVLGGVFDAEDPPGFACATLPGDGSAQYLVITQATSAAGAATYPVTLLGAAGSTPAPAAAPLTLPSWVGVQAPEGLPPSFQDTAAWRTRPFAEAARGAEDVQALWDRRIRATEGDLVRESGVPPTGLRAPAAVSGPAAVPAVGERRTFSVYRGPGDFAQVTAVARFVGSHAALFVDETAPGGGFTNADLQLFSERFDDYMHPTVTAEYGSESDLDGNQRVIILFTPVVNALTPRGASGFIGGFFFGVDLLPDQNGSNAGEIFYTLVPDPSGTYSDPRTTEALLNVTPAVLAHEFQHMVNFNQRVLQRDAEGNEAVWLSEALAQYAEELVARVYEREGDAASVELFRGGVRTRARRYLTRTDTVSLVVSVGQGSLPERGAGYLLLDYLAGRFGPSVVRSMTQTTRTGRTNVEVATGTNWPELLSDWWAATWLDGLGIASGPLEYGDTDLRTFLKDPFPLIPDAVPPGDFEWMRSMRSSSASYYIVTPPAGSSVTLRIAGAGGGPSAPQAGAQMRVVRVR